MYKTGILILTGVSSLALTGCAFRTQTTGMAVEYNEFVAQTTNKQTVLNILRSREREPMHFTSFGLVRGTVRGQGNAEAGASIAADTAQTVLKTIEKTSTAATGAVSSEATLEDTLTDTDNRTSLSPKLALQVSTGTDFDINVNATDDFYRGILGPLKESVAVHFLRQNFPADLLSHLMIGELRFYVVFKKNGKDIDQQGNEHATGKEKYGPALVAVIRNTPDQNDDARAFEDALDCRKLSYVTDRRDKRSIGFNALSDLSAVTPELLARVTADGDPAKYKYNIGESSDFRLALSEPGDCGVIGKLLRAQAVDRVDDFARDLKLPGAPIDARAKVIAIETAASPRPTQLRARRSADQRPADETSPSEGLAGSGTYEFESKNFFKSVLQARGVDTAYSGDLVIEVTLRSVEGMIYYLGEYIRDPAISPKLYGTECPFALRSEPCIPILVVEDKARMRAPTFVNVVYRGRRYEVPLSGRRVDSTAGQSSQTISLVQQLLNLHRTSKDMPVTPLVRVAN